MRSIYLFIVSISLICSLSAQEVENTVGLLTYNINQTYDGYTLIYPLNQSNVYLLNNCGEVVHTWEDTGTRPGNTAFIRANGDLVKAVRPASIAGDPIWAPGAGASIEVRTWDNELISSYTQNDENGRLHHDIDVLPNGNVIAIVWKYRSKEEAIAAGRDSMNLPQGSLWPDGVIEVDMTTGEVVWEWNVWDHLIQDYDETKSNFGVVADHPELVDLNWDTSNGAADWNHVNAIDYNPLYDQIVLSVPAFSEIWIIDHSTTTAQAASSTGGLYGRGGDLLYRWGNPAVYDAGDSTDQKLFYQHDSHWNIDFISPAHPNFNKMVVFNNQVGADFSTANMFNTMFDDYGGNYMIMDGQYVPDDFDLTITHPDPQRMYSTGLSSVQQLPNDNYLITVGRFGYSYELTPNNDIVWEYITPIKGGASVPQGFEDLGINDNLTFKSFRYPVSFGAFTDKDLSPKGWIELEPNEDYCAQLVDNVNVNQESSFKMFPVPVQDLLYLNLKDAVGKKLEVYNLTGQLVYSSKLDREDTTISVSDWKDGLYLVVVDSYRAGRFIISR